MKNRSVAFVDKQVILTMITCMIVAVTVFAFRYKNYEPYTPVEISVRDGKIIKGQIVRLTAKTKKYSSEELIWDFGDKSKQKGNGTMVTHIYSDPGKYEVTLCIKGKRREYQTIYVVEEPALPKPKPVTFICPPNVKVGELVSFEDVTHKAVSWEWKFGETNRVDAITRKTNYTFTSPGPKKITLVINGSIQGDTTIDISKKIIPKNDTTIIPKILPPIQDHPNEPVLKEQQKAMSLNGSHR